MADYQDIRGLRVKYLSADPSNIADGEVWYNSTSGTLKTQIVSEAWSSGGNLNTTRKSNAAAGTKAAAVCMGGNTGAPILNASEDYDGSTWTTGNPINTARYQGAGFGTQTTAVLAGGSPGSNVSTNATENYDGTNWTSSGSLITPRMAYSAGGAGTQTAGVVMAGYRNPPSGNVDSVEEYNGASWATNPNAMPSARSGVSVTGTQGAALASGGYPAILDTLTYDGSSFTSVGTMPLQKESAMAGGSQTAAIVAFGSPGAQSSTVLWDGSAWSSGANGATARYELGSSSDNSGNDTGLVAAGATPSPSTATEEYTRAPAVQTITTS